MYVHAVLVLASTRSPALKTGPLPASRFRTVRSTIRPSSAIHRRSQAPQNIRRAEMATPPRKTTLERMAFRWLSVVRSAAASESSAPPTKSDEVDSDTHHSDPGNREELEDTVAQCDLLGLPRLAAVDVDGVTQDRDGERHHGDGVPVGALQVVLLERPESVAEHDRGGAE